MLTRGAPHAATFNHALCTGPETPEKSLCCKGQRMPTGQGARSHFCLRRVPWELETYGLLAIKLVNVLAKD